jgi:hypothetical protein
MNNEELGIRNYEFQLPPQEMVKVTGAGGVAFLIPNS